MRVHWCKRNVSVFTALNPFDAEVERLVNIGPKAISSNKEQKKIHRIRRAAIREAHMSAQLEKAARHRTCKYSTLDLRLQPWSGRKGCLWTTADLLRRQKMVGHRAPFWVTEIVPRCMRSA